MVTLEKMQAALRRYTDLVDLSMSQNPERPSDIRSTMIEYCGIEPDAIDALLAFIESAESEEDKKHVFTAGVMCGLMIESEERDLVTVPDAPPVDL